MRSSNVRYIAIAALAALAFAACSSSSKPASSATTPTTTAAAATTIAAPTATTVAPAATTVAPAGATTVAPAGATTVGLASSKFGQIMVDSKGMTLYVDEKDTSGASSCTGGCATVWPPVPAASTPTFGTGLTASMFSTITRADGSKQLAVNVSPLYTFASDAKPGDATGQGVNGFYVVAANGKQVG